MSISNTYTSIACNRSTEAADWGNNGLIVFGACNAVAIYDPKFQGNSAKILYTWVQHKKRVNTVRWLRETPSTSERYILSGSDDGLAILWNCEDPTQPKYYTLKGHESGVNAVAGLSNGKDNWLLVTASADSTVKLWNFNGTECTNFQTIVLNCGFCFTLRLTRIPKSDNVLLAFSADDESIALWAHDASADSDQFRCVYKLLGHEDWVRGLDFVTITETDELLLASSSQDHFIRMWRIAPRNQNQVNSNKMDVLQVMELNDEIRMEEKIIQIGESAWVSVNLESVLYGHENWVYSVHWHQSEEHGLRLLSASIDKSLIVWARTEDGIWMEKVRCGDVGGNSLGFFGGKFSCDGKRIFGHSYSGGFHMWSQSATPENIWVPNVITGGHFGEVRDIAWEPWGEYLMSVSADQTTRIHAPWLAGGRDGDAVTWHEIARPQVHGYDMQALAILMRYRFASGAEEKITRSFQSSANFIENFRHLSGITQDVEGDALLASLPKGASVPSLGLSNKAVFSVDRPTENTDKHVKDEYPENYFVPVSLDEPPQEETLMQNTLWPEIHKLYGHGYEIYALAATADGQLLASSCRSSNAEHAQIILWNTTTWKQIQKLPAHQLTVTQMSFSPDGRYLLAVSRDRSWSLHKRQETEQDGTALSKYALMAHSNKTNTVHTRIIWSCDWSHDGELFVTSSRDGKVVVWCHNSTKQTELNGWHSRAVLEFKNVSVTAVAFGRKMTKDGSYLVAMGMESGVIKIYKLTGLKWLEMRSLNNDQAHHLTVRRLQFRPHSMNHFHLASCGDDNLVRIYEFNA